MNLNSHSAGELLKLILPYLYPIAVVAAAITGDVPSCRVRIYCLLTVSHQRDMISTANSLVSWLVSTLTKFIKQYHIIEEERRVKGESLS
jgi:hypothetical protein